MKTTPILLDRLEKALASQNVVLKRSQLLELAAAAFGFRNSNEFSAASKRGDLTPPPVTPIGRIALPDGQAVLIVKDGLAGAPFGIEETFVDQVVESERAEQLGVSPYGCLTNLTELAGKSIPDLMSGSAHAMAAAELARNIHTIACIDADERDLALEALSEIRALCDQSQAAPGQWRADAAPVGEIYTAIIEHQHGTDSYVAPTRKGVIDQIAKHCAEFWSTVAGEDDVPDTMDGLTSQQIVDFYYGAATDEFYTINKASAAVDLCSAPTSSPSAEAEELITVWTGYVDHRHGNNSYVALSEADLVAQIAAYCDEYWHEVVGRPDVPGDTNGLSDQEMVTIYFDANDEEFYSVDSSTLPIDRKLADALIAKRAEEIRPTLLGNVELPPRETLRYLADTCAKAVQSDVWYDAQAFGDSEGSNLIEELQSAISDAGRILKSLSTATASNKSAPIPSANTKVDQKGNPCPVWITDREGDPVFEVTAEALDELGIPYAQSEGDCLGLTEAEFEVVRSKDTQHSEFGGFAIYLGESVLAEGRKYHAPYIEIVWDDDGNGPSRTESSVQLAAMLPRIERSAKALGGWATAEYEATDSSHTLQVFLPFSVAEQAPATEAYFRALDYLFNALDLPDDQRGMVTFTPQAWVNDYAVETDAEGERQFDAGFECLLWGYDQNMLREPHNRDELRNAHLAPDWIKNHSGPFEVYDNNYDTSFFDEHIKA